jgi:phosphonopyruvate decarboxylase
MNGMLAEMGLQGEVLPDYSEGAIEVLDAAVHHMKTRQSPYALIVKRQVFNNYKLINQVTNNYPMNREQALKVVLNNISQHDITVGTTGFLSRELEELRRAMHQASPNGLTNEQPIKDFLTVGSMGHSSSIALGISLFKPSRKVFCLDGDGACIMHMGALPQNASHG